MKSIKFTLTALCLLLLFASCAATSSSTTHTSSATSSQSVSSSQSSGNLGDYHVEIKSVKLAKTAEGAPCVIVTYEWSHSKEDSASFMASFIDKVYQNGIECDFAYLSEINDNYMKSIKAGATLEVEQAYLIEDLSADIEVEVKEFLSLDNKKIEKTFSISAE